MNPFMSASICNDSTQNELKREVEIEINDAKRLVKRKYKEEPQVRPNWKCYPLKYSQVPKGRLASLSFASPIIKFTDCPNVVVYLSTSGMPKNLEPLEF